MMPDKEEFYWFGWRLSQTGDKVIHSQCLANVGLDRQVWLYAGAQTGINGYYWVGSDYRGYGERPARAERRLGYRTLEAAQQAAEEWAAAGQHTTP